MEEMLYLGGIKIPRQMEKTGRTEIITIRLDCGCEVVYKELGAVSCAAHGQEDPVRQKTEF